MLYNVISIFLSLFYLSGCQPDNSPSVRWICPFLVRHRSGEGSTPRQFPPTTRCSSAFSPYPKRVPLISSFGLPFVRRHTAATGLYAQENPPVGAQPEGIPLPRPSPESLEPHENADICLHVSSLPQDGHSGGASPSDAKTSLSKQLPHLSHRYS